MLYISFLLICLQVSLTAEKLPLTTNDRYFNDYILCRWCGADLAHPESITNVLSPFASSVKNISAFGFHNVLQQNLENPFGITFDIVTVSKSVCYEKLNHDWEIEYTWFPGYYWKPCVCNHCRRTLGWIFRKKFDDVSIISDDGFYGLMTEKIVSERYAMAETASAEKENIPDDTSSAHKPDDLDDGQKAFLERCEAEFANRYGEEDTDYKKLLTEGVSDPPVVDPWYNKPRRNYNWSRGGGGGGQHQRRDWGRHGGGGGYGHHRRNNDYRRPNRYHGYGGDNGSRYNAYNRNRYRN